MTNYDHEKQKTKYEDDAQFRHNQATPSLFDPFSHPGGHNTPRVGSLYTMYKNQFILLTSIGSIWICYFGGWIPLVWDNDAGAFFNDCMTMWTQYVYFYKDEKKIQYSYV